MSEWLYIMCWGRDLLICWYKNWFLAPKLYVKEDFIGGCDIIKEMHETGELKELLSSRGIDVKPS